MSLYLDDEHIYYLNVLHKGEQLSYEDTKKFLEFLFALDIEIVGHNLKYDLEIIENFLHSENTKKSKEEIKEIY